MIGVADGKAADRNMSGARSAAESLVEVVNGIEFASLPQGAAIEAKRAFLDGVGVAFAAWNEPWINDLWKYTRSVYAAGSSPVIGSPSMVTPVGSCLVNGALIHALDYDDTAWTYVGHPTAVLLPVCLALGAERRLPGSEVLAAYVTGFEITSLLGRDLFDTLAPRGWHLTSVVGVYGAAATGAKLLQLSARHTMNALGIAASQAAGLKANFGTNTKPLHAGFAARAGLEAALLAGRGISASTTALDGRFGFFPVFQGHVPSFDAQASISLQNDGIAYKKYPTCTGTHPAIDAALTLRQRHEVRPHDIERIRCTVTPEVVDELLYPDPADSYQACFSLPFAVAVAFARGQFTLQDLDDGVVADPVVRDLMSRCETMVDDSLRISASRIPAAEIAVELVGGNMLKETVTAARGNPGNELSTAELKEKFSQCAGSRISADRVEMLAEVLLALDELDDVSVLVPLLLHPQGGGGAPHSGRQ